MTIIQVYIRCAFAYVIALLLICGQNVFASSSNDNIQSTNVRRSTLRKLGSSASASSYSVDTSAVSGPFYVIRQDVNGSLYAQISETYDMDQYETVSCTKSGHHPIIIACTYGGSTLDVKATDEFAIHKTSYHDAYGNVKVVQVDAVEAATQGKVEGKSMTYEEMKQVEAFKGNQVDSYQDTSSSIDAWSFKVSSTYVILKPFVIMTISLVSLLLLFILGYYTCISLIGADDDSDDDDDDEFDDDSQNHKKFIDDHTLVTRGLGSSAGSVTSAFYDVDLSNNESENDNFHNDHIMSESTTNPPIIMQI